MPGTDCRSSCLCSRDYFWMFCHGNGIWQLEETDANLIERPTAPGGATGGGAPDFLLKARIHEC
jgi:hypothetical protein